MDADVIYLDLFPGISESTVRHILNTPGLKGVVMKTFGAGNGPTGEWFQKLLRDAINREIVVVNVTQCMTGSVMPYRYSTGMAMSSSGVVPGHDMTSEAAITKLMYLFGLGLPASEVRRAMQMPIRGELSLD